MKKRRRKAELEAQYASKPAPSSSLNTKSQKVSSIDTASSGQHTDAQARPSPQRSNDQDVIDKYLATKPYKARKGDRFS